MDELKDILVLNDYEVQDLLYDMDMMTREGRKKRSYSTEDFFRAGIEYGFSVIIDLITDYDSEHQYPNSKEELVKDIEKVTGLKYLCSKYF